MKDLQDLTIKDAYFSFIPENGSDCCTYAFLRKGAQYCRFDAQYARVHDQESARFVDADCYCSSYTHRRRHLKKPD